MLEALDLGRCPVFCRSIPGNVSLLAAVDAAAASCVDSCAALGATSGSSSGGACSGSRGGGGPKESGDGGAPAPAPIAPPPPQPSPGCSPFPPSLGAPSPTLPPGAAAHLARHAWALLPTGVLFSSDAGFEAAARELLIPPRATRGVAAGAAAVAAAGAVGGDCCTGSGGGSVAALAAVVARGRQGAAAQSAAEGIRWGALLASLDQQQAEQRAKQEAASEASALVARGGVSEAESARARAFEAAADEPAANAAATAADAAPPPPPLALPMVPPMPGPRRRLGLATLLVPDCDAAVAFFDAGLGFAALQDVPAAADGARARFVIVGPAGGEAAAGEAGAGLCTGLLLREPASAEERARVGSQVGGAVAAVALIVHTEDLARDRLSLIAAGAAFLEEPRVEPYGTVAVWADPWGNRWDLLQPPP